MGVVDESFMRERERKRESQKKSQAARYVTVFVSIDREKPQHYYKARTHLQHEGHARHVS